MPGIKPTRQLFGSGYSFTGTVTQQGAGAFDDQAFDVEAFDLEQDAAEGVQDILAASPSTADGFALVRSSIATR